MEGSLKTVMRCKLNAESPSILIHEGWLWLSGDQSSYGSCWGQCLAFCNPVSVWVYNPELPLSYEVSFLTCQWAVWIRREVSTFFGKGWDSIFSFGSHSLYCNYLTLSLQCESSHIGYQLAMSCLFSNKILFSEIGGGPGLASRSLLQTHGLDEF